MGPLLSERQLRAPTSGGWTELRGLGGGSLEGQTSPGRRSGAAAQRWPSPSLHASA